MCIAIPGKVLSTEGKTARIDFSGEVRDASMKFVDAKRGDYVIVFGGHIIKKLSEKEALDILGEFQHA